MQRKLLGLLIAVLLLTIVFSGCTEQNPENNLNGNEYTTLSDGTKVTGDFNKIEILNYSAETLGGSPLVKIADGFTYSADATRYGIHGTAKNIAGELIKEVRITANYYTSDNKYIRENYNEFYDIRGGDTWIFSVGFYETNNPDFANVHHVIFDIDVIEIGNISSNGESDKFIGSWQNIVDNNITHHFSSDGFYLGSTTGFLGSSSSGDWSIEDGKLFINAEYYINPESKINLTYNYIFSENNMILTLINESNEKQTYEYVIQDT
jgi:hypothetical protein